MERTHSSRSNGLIFSYKKDSSNKVVFVKDRQCFTALPILFLYIGEGNSKELHEQGKRSARATPCPNRLLAGSFVTAQNKYS